MKIFDFCKKYNSFKNEKLREEYLNKHLQVKSYLPFLTKDAIAQSVVNASVYKYEDYVDDNGETKRRRTDEIKLNSVAKRLLFVRSIIENYTNLECETEGFYEEYDELVQSGLIDILMISKESRPSLIPQNEITEIDYFIGLKTDDAIANLYEPHAYVNKQLDKLIALINTAFEPVLNVIAESVGELDEENVEKLVSMTDKVLKVVK